jgi:hypothetical protein
MTDEKIGMTVPPPVCGVKTPLGDPNSTEKHEDVIRTKVFAAMNDESRPLEDRRSAETLFSQMYPKENLQANSASTGE